MPELMDHFKNDDIDISAIEHNSQMNNINITKDDQNLDLMTNLSKAPVYSQDIQQLGAKDYVSPKKIIINKSRQLYLNNGGKSTADERVFERLAKQAQLQNQIKAQNLLQLPVKQSHDLVTGQELFKPLINKNKKVEQMVQGRKQPHQVGQSLYKTHEFYKNKAKLREQNEIDNLAQRRHIASKANDKSDRIIQQARRQQLALIFDRMDSDNDQQISSTKINLSALDPELYNAFKPLLNELEHLGQSLDKEEFVDASLRLYEVS